MSAVCKPLLIFPIDVHQMTSLLLKNVFPCSINKAWVKNHVSFSLFVALGRNRIAKTEWSGTLFHIIVCLLRPLLVVSFYSFCLKGDINSII